MRVGIFRLVGALVGTMRSRHLQLWRPKRRVGKSAGGRRLVLPVVSVVAPIVGAIFAVAPGQAAQWTLGHRLSTTAEFSDNKSLALLDQRDTFGVVADMELVLARKTERSSLSLRPRLRRSEFWGDSRVVDSTDKFLVLSGEMLGELWAARASVDLREDTTRASELDDDDVGVNRVNLKRNRAIFRPDFSYRLSERVSASLRLGYENLDYQNVERTNLQPYDYYNGGFTLSRAMTERTVLSGTVAADFFRPEENLSRTKVPTDTYSASIGVTHALSPSLSMSGSFGVRRTTQRVLVRSVTVDKTISRGTTFAISFDKQFERAELSGALSRSIAPTGTGASRDRTVASFRGEYQISPVLTALASGRVRYDSRPDSETLRDSDQNYSGSAGLQWRLDRNWNAALLYSYRAQETATVNYRDRNTVLFRLRYRGDDMEW